MARDNLIRQNMHAFGQSATRPDPRVNRIMHFLEKNHARIVGREELASIEGVSADYLGKRFKIVTGITIRDYTNRIRVRKSMEILKQPGLRMPDVAAESQHLRSHLQ